MLGFRLVQYSALAYQILAVTLGWFEYWLSRLVQIPDLTTGFRLVQLLAITLGSNTDCCAWFDTRLSRLVWCLAITLGSIDSYHAWFGAWLDLGFCLSNTGCYAWLVWVLAITLGWFGYWLSRLVQILDQTAGYHVWFNCWLPRLIQLLAVTLGSNTGYYTCCLSHLVQLLPITLGSNTARRVWSDAWLLLGSILSYHASFSAWF